MERTSASHGGGYDTVIYETVSAIPPPVPLALSEGAAVSLFSAVWNSQQVLKANIEQLQALDLPMDLKPLIQCAEAFLASATDLDRKIRGRESERLELGGVTAGWLINGVESQDTVCREVLEVSLFSEALHAALQGRLGSTQIEVLDRFCPSPPLSSASLAMYASGLGCTIASLAVFGAGFVAHELAVDEDSESMRGMTALALMGGGIVGGLLGLGVLRKARSIALYSETKPAPIVVNEEEGAEISEMKVSFKVRRLLEELNTFVQRNRCLCC